MTLSRSFAVSLEAINEQQNKTSGIPSEEIDDAEDISNHIVVIGCLNNFPVFVAELRRPLIVNSAYHPIVVVSETEPVQWEDVCEEFDDVFWLRGKISHSLDFNRANIREAFALVFLSSRDFVAKVS